MTIWKDETDTIPYMLFGELGVLKNFILHSSAVRSGRDAAVLLKTDRMSAFHINGSSGNSVDLSSTTKVVPVAIETVTYAREPKY